MIHYHGTPLTPRSMLELMAGQCFCVPYPRPEGLRTVLRIAQAVMFDNGAFSAFTRGLPLNVPGFYEWLRPILAPPHWAVISDIIGGSVADQRALIRTFPFRKDLGAPVWHLDEPLHHLFFLCDHWPRVCLGSAGPYWKVGGPSWAGRMDEVFNALAQRYHPLPWIHGLRMLGQGGERWPLASADSTNVAQNFKPGCPKCMANRIDAVQPAGTWNPIPSLLTGAKNEKNAHAGAVDTHTKGGHRGIRRCPDGSA